MAYDAESIKVRDFREACRATPSMYLGDDKENGIFNGFLEILNNSCDEAIMGRGDTITVVVSPNSVSVEDKGAGVPRGHRRILRRHSGRGSRRFRDAPLIGPWSRSVCRRRILRWRSRPRCRRQAPFRCFRHRRERRV